MTSRATISSRIRMSEDRCSESIMGNGPLMATECCWPEIVRVTKSAIRLLAGSRPSQTVSRAGKERCLSEAFV